jgi:hypothetical protein
MALMTGQGPFGHAPAGSFNRLADSRRTTAIFETAMGPRWYFDEHVDLEVDGQPQPRPRTPWSAPRWWERIGRLESQM